MDYNNIISIYKYKIFNEFYIILYTLNHWKRKKN